MARFTSSSRPRLPNLIDSLKCFAVVGAVLGATLSVSAMHAADIIWTGANDPTNTNLDSWNDPQNWNPAQLPGSGDRADVAGGLTANIATGTTTVNTLYVGADNDQSTFPPAASDGFTN